MLGKKRNNPQRLSEKKVQVSFVLEEKIVKEIDEIAEACGWSRSQILGELVAMNLRQNGWYIETGIALIRGGELIAGKVKDLRELMQEAYEELDRQGAI